MATNATILYSGDPKNILAVSLEFFASKSFLELSTLFSLTHGSYSLSKHSMIKAITSKNHNTKLFDALWGYEHLSYTTDKKGIRITVSNQMITLILFLKDPDAMLAYSEHMMILGSSVKILIDELGVREEFPECFV